MGHRCWLLAGVLAVVFACNSDKPSPFATKSNAAGSAAAGSGSVNAGSVSAASGSAASGSATSGSATSGSAAVATGSAAASGVGAATGSAAASGVGAATGAGGAKFQVGEALWGIWDNGIAHQGKVLAINTDGSYQIQWDGAGRNDHWPAANTYREKPAENPLKVGERIWGLTADGSLRGKIKRINANGTLWIVWDDYRVPDAKDWSVDAVSRFKPLPPAVTDLQVSERVDVLWSDNKWYPGKVGAVNADGTYSIKFDDNGEVAVLDSQHVRRRKGSSGRGASSAKAGDKPCSEGTDWTRCSPNSCYQLMSDTYNCGSCGNHCPKTARTCVNGVCKCMSETYDSDGNCM